MSPISLSMDLLLVVLLLAALGFGWRLERRLKGLRASHVDFTKAVADLDRAAVRAEVGLAQLREATDEAVDLLAGRIEKARELASKLDKITVEAASAAQRRPSEAPRANLERLRARPPAAAPAPTDALLAAEALARRLAGDDVLELRTQAPPITRAAPPPVRRPARSMIDDDLFEAPQDATQSGRFAQGGALRGRL